MVPIERFDVVVVGSGPVGSTFARIIKDLAPEATVLLVESGPVTSNPPGLHVGNIRDPAERERAQIDSQGPDHFHQRAFGAAHGARSISAGEEFPVTARPGTWLLGSSLAEPSDTGMPAAAMSCNVGGMGSHWTCATPMPGPGERVTFMDQEVLDAAFDTARALLRVTSTAFDGAPLGEEVRSILAARFDQGRDVERRVQPMPMAISIEADGRIHWMGPDAILDDLATPGRVGFELRAETVARRVLMSADRATGVVLHSMSTGADYQVDARFVVVAGDALRTPQLLFASGVRPAALGHYLNDQPQVSGTIRLDDSLVPNEIRQRSTSVDRDQVLSGVSWIPYDSEFFPFHGQIMQKDASPVPIDNASETWPGSIVECGLFAPKDIRWEDRLEFDETRPDYFGLPGMTIHYGLTRQDSASVDRMIDEIEIMAGLLGELVNGNRPFHFPDGSSLHYQGTVRMGATDDGTSVCDPTSRIWGTTNLFVGGNGVIPTPTACNPTLTSVANAVIAATEIATALAGTVSATSPSAPLHSTSDNYSGTTKGEQ